MHKSVALLFIALLTLSSLLMVKPEFAQSLTKPAMPEFTLRLVEHPYDVAPVTETDPYTGETVIIEEGRHVENRTIELVIKNTPFTPYTDSNGNYVVLSYNISVKGHYADDWKYYPNAHWKIPLIQSKTDRTTITFGYYNESDPYSYLINVPNNGQLDFRVERKIGYFTKAEYRVPVPGGEFYHISFIGESSGWSSIQTISIGDNGSTAAPTSSPLASSPTPTESSSQNTTVTSVQPVSGGSVVLGLDWVGVAVVVLLGVVVVLLVLVVVFLRRRR